MHVPLCSQSMRRLCARTQATVAKRASELAPSRNRPYVFLIFVPFCSCQFKSHLVRALSDSKTSVGGVSPRLDQQNFEPRKPYEAQSNYHPLDSRVRRHDGSV